MQDKDMFVQYHFLSNKFLHPKSRYFSSSPSFLSEDYGSIFTNMVNFNPSMDNNAL